MYISRVEIDRADRQKIRELSHLGAYHHWVEQSFPKEWENHTRSRKLWRIDRLRHREYLLIVSETAPDLQQLETYGVAGTARTKSYDAFLQSLQEQQSYRFKLTANPVKAESDRSRKRGRVVPILQREEQLHYLAERAETNGFEVQPEAVMITESGREMLKKTNSRDVRLLKVTYEGVLKITDKKRFLSALTHGIGKKKAYGFGLMTVIPLSSQ